MGSFLKPMSITLAAVSVLAIINAIFLQTPETKVNHPSASQDEILKVVIAGSPHESDYLPFDWKTYEDPARPEFWADGEDGIMPRPFLHLAGEPTIENARQLLAWKKKQWAVVEQVIKALGGAAELDLYKQVIGKSIVDVAAELDPMYRLASARVNKEEGETKTENMVDWSSLQVVYIYRSTCPHCITSKSLIGGLETLGAKVTTLQIDHKSEKPLHPNSLAYTEDLQQFFPLENGEPTPTFFFRYKGKEPFSHIGKLSLSYLTNHLKGDLTKKNKEI